MKLLLVNPYFDCLVYAPTLGLNFLASYIREHAQCDVKVLEPLIKKLDENALIEEVSSTDYLGLSCYTESRFQCFDFAKKAKLANPRCQIIIGGPHVMTLDRQILEHYPFVDIVIRGEAEKSLVQIINKMPMNEIGGITWRQGGKIIQNLNQQTESDISQFHFDYSSIMPEIKDWKDIEVPRNLQRKRSVPIISSRGCPFRCTFCASNNQWGGVWRGLSPEQLVREMAELVIKYNIGYFRFYDALFIGREDQLFKFCDLLEKENLKIQFRIDIRVGTKREALKRLREVGCSVVGFGVESGSDRVLKRINKGITRKQIDETIEICRTLNYWLLGFFMVSLPDETLADFKRTTELFHRFDVINLQFFKIHPNTSFYKELKARNEINDEAWFDRSHGAEIFYSKEAFSSANFYRNNVDEIIAAIMQKHKLRKPLVVIRNYGPIKGFAVLLFSAIRLILSPNKKVSAFLISLKKGWLGQLVKRG